MTGAINIQPADSSLKGRLGGALKLKVCGMKYADNIREVAKLSPDFMGFIFYPKSKRYVGKDFIMPELPIEIKKVGVFVNESAENILATVRKHDLDLVQLHGDESFAFCANASKIFKAFEARGVQIIKAFGIDEQLDFSSLNEYENSCDYFLFDTKTKEYGGSGKSFDWNLLSNYKGNKVFFLSGGIGLDEIPHLNTDDSRLIALDVNSKFEIEPGLKDISKLKILKDELSGKR